MFSGLGVLVRNEMSYMKTNCMWLLTSSRAVSKSCGIMRVSSNVPIILGWDRVLRGGMNRGRTSPQDPRLLAAGVLAGLEGGVPVGGTSRVGAVRSWAEETVVVETLATGVPGAPLASGGGKVMASLIHENRRTLLNYSVKGRNVCIE